MADKHYKMKVTLTDGTEFSAGVFTAPQGPAGEQGPQGEQGIQGPQGEGVPSGGTAGQFLQKTADGTAWADVTGGGSNVTIYADDFEASNISITNDLGADTMKIYFTLPEPNGPSNPYMSSTNTTYGRYATAKLMIAINDDPATVIEIDVPTSVSSNGTPVVARAAGGINANVVYRVSNMSWATGNFYIIVRNLDEAPAPAGLSITELKEKTLLAALYVNNFVVGQSE